MRLDFQPLEAASDRLPEPESHPEEAEAAVRVLLEWAGDDPTREGLLDTPARVARSYRELFSGYDTDPRGYHPSGASHGSGGTQG